MRRPLFYGLLLFSLIFNIVFIVHLIGMNSEPSRTSDIFGKDVKLTDAQKKIINSECTPFRKENSELEQILTEKKAKLLNLLKEKNIDTDRIESCIEEINSIQKKIQLNVVKQLIIYKTHMNREQCSCFMNNLGKEMDVDHVCDENCSCSSK